MPDATPAEVLAFFMQVHDLRQSDLSAIAPQGHISAMLHGKRPIGLEMAKAFAKRFNVSPQLFLDISLEAVSKLTQVR
jgi:antitoxin component HigA of HigAB toxin-antitoxin module